MAARELNALDTPSRALAGMWARAYTAVWGVTFLAAAIVACTGPAVRDLVRSVLVLRLRAASNPAPSAERVAALALHNIPIACWPVLLGVFGAHRHPWGRRVCDVLVACWVAASTVPVGAALGAYGTRVLCFVPQLPIEWAGLALGASCWLVQRERPLTFGRGSGLAGACAGVMTAAAFVEVFVPPHQ
jgi:hypothetical protein